MVVKYTGERYLPELDAPEISYEHWHRYLYAAQFVAGREVLDVAAGEGFGSQLLAATASHVIGVDNERAAVEHAARAYPRANLTFLHGAAEALPCAGTDLFDVVVSFETLEHLDAEQQQRFGRELKRVLRPGGQVLISTPNKRWYSDAADFHNAFHQHELYEDEFVAFLRELFAHVSILGQHVYPTSYIWPQRAASRNIVEFQLAHSADAFHPIHDDRKQLRYMLAVCSDTPYAAPGGSVLLDISERATEFRLQQLVETNRAVEQLREQLAELSAHAAQAEQRERAARELLVEAHTELLRRDIELQAAHRMALESMAPSAPAVSARQQERTRLRLVAQRNLPPGAVVLVASLGDDALLDLGQRHAQHFPQAAHGAYADFSLADGPGAIAHLEALRQQGAEYLLVPASVADWFNSFVALRRHLVEHYRQVTNIGNVCVVYALGDAASSARPGADAHDWSNP